MNRINLYLPDGYPDKIKRLMRQLKVQGVDLSDQRGHDSVSALFRHLIDSELEESKKDKTPKNGS